MSFHRSYLLWPLHFFSLCSFLLLSLNFTPALATTPAHEELSPEYIVALNQKYRFLWFRVAKVGSSTIKVLLREHKVDMPFMSDHFYFDKDKYKDYFKFAFVRNPWDRVVSCYFQKVANKNPKWAFYYGKCFDKGFDYFVRFIDKQDLRTADRHIRLQTALIPVDEVDFIGRLENFNQDLSYVLNVIGIEESEIPKKNPSSHEHYSHYYNEKTKAIIARKYAEDIAAFGYEFESKP